MYKEEWVENGSVMETKTWDITTGYKRVNSGGTVLEQRNLTDAEISLVTAYDAAMNAQTIQNTLKANLTQLIANESSAAPLLLNLTWAGTTHARMLLLEKSVVALTKLLLKQTDSTTGT